MSANLYSTILNCINTPVTRESMYQYSVRSQHPRSPHKGFYFLHVPPSSQTANSEFSLRIFPTLLSRLWIHMPKILSPTLSTYSLHHRLLILFQYVPFQRRFHDAHSRPPCIIDSVLKAREIDSRLWYWKVELGVWTWTSPLRGFLGALHSGGD